MDSSHVEIRLKSRESTTSALPCSCMERLISKDSQELKEEDVKSQQVMAA